MSDAPSTAQAADETPEAPPVLGGQAEKAEESSELPVESEAGAKDDADSVEPPAVSDQAEPEAADGETEDKIEQDATAMLEPDVNTAEVQDSTASATEPAEELEADEIEPATDVTESDEPEATQVKQTAVDDGDSEDDESEESEADAEQDEEQDGKMWYVVKVQSGREDSIKDAIERRVKIEGLDEFFGQILIPVDKEYVKVRGQRKVRERKRFPGYIMAKVEFNDQILYLFRETSGVGDFVGGSLTTAPQPMSDQEVAHMYGIMDMKTDKPAGTAEKAPFDIGDRVKVKEGVFKDTEGEVKELLEEKGEVRIEVIVLGRPVSVELEYWQVEDV